MQRRTALSALGVFACTGTTRAQASYPSRPIQVIAPASAGGVSDIAGRIYADRLSKILGQPVTIVNRPGAGTVIGTQVVATAAPDGYTLLVTNSAHSITQFVQPSLPYDPLKDFVGIAMIADAPAVVAIASTTGIKSLKELITLAKAKPRTFDYSSAGVGSTTHLAGAHFCAKAKVEMVHVPYKDYAQATADFVSGRVPVIFAPAGYLLPLVRVGRVTPLGVSTGEDMTQPFEAPSVFKTTGIDYEYTTWYGFLAPAKTPRPVLDVLAKAFAEASKDPELRATLLKQGVFPKSMLMGDFDMAMRAEVDKVRPLISASDIKTN